MKSGGKEVVPYLTGIYDKNRYLRVQIIQERHFLWFSSHYEADRQDEFGSSKFFIGTCLINSSDSIKPMHFIAW